MRILVSGLGPITCIGKSVDSLHSSLKNGDCGIENVTQTPWILATNPCGVASVVKDFKFEEYVHDRNVLKLLKGPQCRTVQLGIAAGLRAVQDSGVDLETCNKERIGVFVGTFGNLDYIKCIADSLQTPQGPNPEDAFIGYPGATASILSNLLDARGPSDTISGGCPSGMDAVGFAMHSIQLGIIDAAIVVGADNEFCEMTYNTIGASNGLSSKFNDDPKKASRPFDIHRGGNVIGENAGGIFIETEEHAKRRKVPKIYASLAGYAKTSAGTRVYKYSNPDLGTNAIVRAFEAVVRSAGWIPSSVCITTHEPRLHYFYKVDLVSANGSASVSYDKLEAKSIVRVFGPNIPVHSIKGMTGQSGSGCTMAQIMAACLTLSRQIVYGTLNCDEPDPALLPLNIIQRTTTEGLGLAHSGAKQEVKRVICHAIGLGGYQYSCLALERYNQQSKL